MLTRLETDWVSSVAILVVSLSVSAIFSPELFALIFQCVCPHFWAGGAAQCAIHMAAARPCPWCNMEQPFHVLLYLGIVAPQAWLSFRPRVWTWPLRLTAALLAFPVMGTLEAAALGAVTGYWR